ncbi:MAG: DUF4164 family protein [Methylobacterium sp.]|nr:DUF4164 family protein [Methylobacterium sp.]MCA3654818.1 DUF4164 family protein [Methylobacterium sp.]MCA3658807.1 DUF4164 family protein [Methylobacterium sp.]MCA3664407.1 DUF4164 family protein [Methylobacterium sp.]MCA3665662.1 DUF4164 family protein [Methylobacterium sp.]
MSDPVAEALSRLSAALDRLDAAAIRHVEADRVRATLETELAVMREDRHHLAEMLDLETVARLEAEQALRDCLPRLDRAIAQVKAGLAGG